MRTRDDHKEITIREKAIEMIVKEGFDGLSMQKLAKSAGISASTIYTYFKNREDLLTKLYIEVQDTFERDALKGFSPEMSFPQGLWLQWENRFRNICENPVAFRFYEQFRSSPLINHNDIKPTLFRNAMNRFFINALSRNEIKPLEPELFWAIAYGPFYTLVKFHLDQTSMSHAPFTLSESTLRQAFSLVLTALQPGP